MHTRLLVRIEDDVAHARPRQRVAVRDVVGKQARRRALLASSTSAVSLSRSSPGKANPQAGMPSTRLMRLPPAASSEKPRSRPRIRLRRIGPTSRRCTPERTRGIGGPKASASASVAVSRIATPSGVGSRRGPASSTMPSRRPCLQVGEVLAHHRQLGLAGVLDEGRARRVQRYRKNGTRPSALDVNDERAARAALAGAASRSALRTRRAGATAGARARARPRRRAGR